MATKAEAGESTDAETLDPDLLKPSGSLLAAQIAVSAAIRKLAVAQTGWDPTSLDLLVRIQLSPDGALRAVDLCSQLQLSPSHVSRMIDRVESKGLVERRPDPDDRRASLVVISETGRAVVDDFAPRLHRVLKAVFSEILTQDETSILVQLLDRVAAAAESLADF